MSVSANFYFSCKQQCKQRKCLFYNACFPQNPRLLHSLNFQAIQRCPQEFVASLLKEEAKRQQKIEASQQLNWQAALKDLKKASEDVSTGTEIYVSNITHTKKGLIEGDERSFAEEIEENEAPPETPETPKTPEAVKQ